MWLTRLALRNPILILMVSLGALVLGWTSLSRLPVDLFPAITPPLVQVATFYQGASPVDIEKTITYPIEKAVSSVSGVDHVESTSKQGVSVVRVWFNWGANLDVGEIDIIERLQQIINTLPPGVQQPFVLKIDLSNIPVCVVTATASDRGGPDERELRDLAYNVIEPQLEHLPHVASADVSGGKTRQVNVDLDREALKSVGVGVQDVVRAVASSNLLLPSGNLRAGRRDYNLFTNTQFTAVKPIGDIVLKTGSTGAVHISDVGKVVDGAQDQTDIVRVLTRHEIDDPDHPGQKKVVIDGGRGVSMRVLKQPGANTIDVVDHVKALLPKLRGVPDSVRLGVFFDQSTYIRSAITSLQHEALTGSLLAVIVILLFIRSVRSTLIIGIAIPLSIVATFILLFFLDQSLNVFTLGGLALGVGRLVDDSIVELENIQRHLNLNPADPEGAALAAAQEVAMPILVSTITTIVVFFPVVFMIGVPKLLFIPLTLTIAFSLICSFFVSRTVTPILCVKLLKPEGEHDQRTFTGRLLARSERAVEALDHGYERALKRVLSHRRLVIASTLALFAGSCFLVRFIGKDFFPETDESQFTVFMKLPVGTRMEETEKAAKKMEQTILEAVGPEVVKTVVTSAGIPQGRSALFTANTGPHAANIQVNLVSPADRHETDIQLMERVRKLAFDGRFAGMNVYFFNGGIVKRILNFGSDAPIDVEITGYDLKDARTLAASVMSEMRGIDGLADVQNRREENYPELDVVVDREKAARLGFSQQEIANTILTSMSGDTNTPSVYTDPVTGNEYYIIVKLADRWRTDVRDLSEVFLPSRTGGAPVALSTMAHIVRSSGPVQVDRKYQQRVIDIVANVFGRDLGAVTDEIERKVGALQMPAGFSVRLSGQSQAQREAFQGLMLAALLALMLVYMVMASQFRSLLDPLIIMFSVPMGLIGVFTALLVTHTSLSVNSFMGIIMMVGIVVSNGVLLIDYTRVLREVEKLPVLDAVVRAGRTRLRPILMTTLATVLGLLPMALGIGEGSEANVPLARAVIGGLTVSTGLTLLLIPSLYVSVESRHEKRRQRTAGEAT
jgi:CzcA family heavy metal efflux pump